MLKYIQNEDHYREVISRVSKVNESLWIGTADIKDLYVGKEFELVDAACNQFDAVWNGSHCKGC